MRAKSLMWMGILGLAAAAAIFSLGACGGGGDDEGSTDDKDTPAEEATQQSDDSENGNSEGEGAFEGDSCTLLTREEIEAAVGNPVEDGENDFFSCGWDSDPEAISVSVHLTSIPEDMCSNGRTEEAEDFPDVGVESWWEYTEAAGTGSVVACLDETMVQLVLVGAVSTTTPEEPLRSAADELMPKVIDRMGG